jgi:HAD superfamily hydrolase (TIGR01509 family)
MVKSPISLIIFDCDGVLVDSEVLACGAVAQVLEEIGIKITTDQIVSRYAGISAATMYGDLEREWHRTIPRDVREAVTNRVLAEFERDLQAMPGVEAVLQSLRCKFCVASSSTIERTRFSLQRTRLLGYFEGRIFSATQVARGKPWPDLFELAAKTMISDYPLSMVIEDSIAGITAARAAGMFAVGFIGGSHCSESHADLLCSAGAQTIFRNMQDLPKILSQFDLGIVD